jgi:hypothetical protein
MYGYGFPLRVGDFKALSLIGCDGRSIGMNIEPVREDAG